MYRVKVYAENLGMSFELPLDDLKDAQQFAAIAEKSQYVHSVEILMYSEKDGTYSTVQSGSFV